jgi:hypothetical protein
MNSPLNWFYDAESERGRVPSGIEYRTNFELVERVNAAISRDLRLCFPNGNGHNGNGQNGKGGHDVSLESDEHTPS